ncbi:glycosyltransferase [Microvirga sp. STR05]|uniref:Glycosyltransferase n=1 Tax=Hymenobacter duratus TaxID=2771356 RepID=A0ABR8JJ25_9BACT|nr:glycosyltransferase [Hymenobacter duratus]MBD2715721.1 glycosyltransferase [Hymenobacter duratus]MBR7950632.1 glycosyltransferase [Microvirga sp. STR05]
MPTCLMSEYRISYVLTTYNKLPYLRHVLERLVAARQPDEEIVVADGGSNDGTPEYLQQLHEAGKIQQFISERDKGEAHGFNKCMFMARGEVIKFITDDDAFYYPAIRQAVDFMTEHPEVDVVMGYNAALQSEDMTFARVKEDPAKDYQRWLDHKVPFWMIGLPLLIRRSVLPLTGFFYTGVVLVDLEFIYRITSLNVNIAWCTAVLSMHISNPNGNFNRMSVEKRTREYNRIYNFFMPTPPPRSLGSVLRETVEAAKRPIRPAKRALFERMGWNQYQDPERFATDYVPVAGEDPVEAAFRVCDSFLAAHNATRPIQFIYRRPDITKVFTP